MTPRQMYSELAKIAGHVCGDNKVFLLSRRPTMAHVEVIQRRILALLEKIDYDRTVNDFRRVYTEGAMPRPRPEVDEESNIQTPRRAGWRGLGVGAIRPPEMRFHQPQPSQSDPSSLVEELGRAQRDRMMYGVGASNVEWNTPIPDMGSTLRAIDEESPGPVTATGALSELTLSDRFFAVPDPAREHEDENI